MNTPALLRFKTEDHSELFLYTIFPSMIVYKIFVSTANGLPFTSTKSASFPSSMLPTRSWTSICFAALIVTACNAVNSSSPLAIAFPAQSGRYCSSLTGESVIIQTEHPASARSAAVEKLLFFNSYLVAYPKEGPTASDYPSFASSSAIRLPSVT